jgi:hypothetical protein
LEEEWRNLSQSEQQQLDKMCVEIMLNAEMAQQSGQTQINCLLNQWLKVPGRGAQASRLCLLESHSQDGRAPFR